MQSEEITLTMNITSFVSKDYLITQFVGYYGNGSSVVYSLRHTQQYYPELYFTTLNETHTRLTAFFFWVSQYQKGKTNLDFTETRHSEWQWHQLGHMQVYTSLRSKQICTSAPHHSVFSPLTIIIHNGTMYLSGTIIIFICLHCFQKCNLGTSRHLQYFFLNYGSRVCKGKLPLDRIIIKNNF